MKNRVYTVGAVSLLLFLGGGVAAKVINTCGVYHAEGYYTEIASSKGKERVILLDRGTESQITFHIRNKDLTKMLPDAGLGVNFELKLRFISSCWYDCEGDIVQVIRPVSPFERLKTFLYPRPNPIQGTEAKCQPDPFEH